MTALATLRAELIQRRDRLNAQMRQTGHVIGPVTSGARLSEINRVIQRIDELMKTEAAHGRDR